LGKSCPVTTLTGILKSFALNDFVKDLSRDNTDSYSKELGRMISTFPVRTLTLILKILAEQFREKLSRDNADRYSEELGRTILGKSCPVTTLIGILKSFGE
jgi:hypothetical protein